MWQSPATEAHAATLSPLQSPPRLPRLHLPQHQPPLALDLGGGGGVGGVRPPSPAPWPPQHLPFHHPQPQPGPSQQPPGRGSPLTNSVIKSIGDLSLRPAPAKRVRFENGAAAPGPGVAQEVAAAEAAVADGLGQMTVADEAGCKRRKVPAKLRQPPVSDESNHPLVPDPSALRLELSQELRDFVPEPALPEAIVKRAMREIAARTADAASSSSPSSSSPSTTALVPYEPQKKFLQRVIGVPSRIDEEEEEEDESDNAKVERMEDDDDGQMMID